MTSGYNFSVSRGSLEVSGPSGAQRQIRPDGLDVLRVLPADDGLTAFVLLDPPPGTGRLSNLLRVHGDGFPVWRAELPSGDPTDTFLDMQTGPRQELWAWTWSGKKTQIDPADGRLLSGDFTK